MALAAENNRHAAIVGYRGLRLLEALLAAVLMAIAANCFLKYLWWAACYSAWYGLPKFADQWKAAGAHASFNFWSVIVLEIASAAVLFLLMPLPSSDASVFLRIAPRAMFSFIITIAGTAAFVLALSWIKQGIH